MQICLFFNCVNKLRGKNHVLFEIKQTCLKIQHKLFPSTKSGIFILWWC